MYAELYSKFKKKPTLRKEYILTIKTFKSTKMISMGAKT